MIREVLIRREVISKLVPMVAGMGIKVTQRGAQAYVRVNRSTNRPELVNILHVPDNAGPAFILAIQGFIDHEVGHILCTDFTVTRHLRDVAKKIASDRGIKDTGRIEMMFRKLCELHNLVEDPFVERGMQKRFPGCAFNFDKLYSHVSGLARWRDDARHYG